MEFSFQSKPLNFGATNFIGVYLAPQIIAHFHKKHPNIKINMVINSSKNILEMLHRNQLEFVFLSGYILHEPEQYIINDYITDDLMIIVGNKHHLFSQDTCSLSDIQDDLYITKEPDSSQYRFLKNILSKHNFEFTNQLFISNQEAIKESVINNLGITIMSKHAFEREIEAGLVNALELNECKIERQIQYIYIKDKYLTPAAKAFIDLL